MHQAVFIHGGETFNSYDAYIAALKSWTYEPGKETQKRWKHVLPERLGDEWTVFAPTMPSKYNAKYSEWSIWFEKVIPYLSDDVVLIGHSLGGIFLAKYLNENTLSVRVKATFLISAPYDTADTEYELADFVLPEELSGLRNNGGLLYLYHSTDDDIVPFSAFQKYQAQLPDAAVRIFEDRGHILQEEFPELIADIHSLF